MGIEMPAEDASLVPPPGRADDVRSEAARSSWSRPAREPLADAASLRVFLLTSHPVDGRNGADTEMCIGLAQGLEEVAFTYFGRLGRRPIAPGRVVPLASRTGHPGLLEGAQVTTWVPVVTRSVDLVHAVMTIGPRYAAWSRSRFAPQRKPVILTVPGVVSPECLVGARPWDVSVALSEATADLLRGAGHADVRVIPPGIDLARMPYRPAEPKPRPVLFFAGHTDRHGGVPEAIAAAARVQDAGIPLRLVLGLRVRSGQTESRELAAADAAARRAGLDQVEAHGHIEDMARALADADVVLFTPERLAGGKADIPFVVLEALATGRPAVVTRLPQMAGLTGIVEQVPVGSPDDAAAAISRLLSQPAFWAERSRSGRATVEERFSTARMCADYAQLYREVSARGQGAASMG